MYRPNSHSLREALKAASPDRFWRQATWGCPNYRRALHDILAAQYPSGYLPIKDILTDRYPHPSTLQRMVAAEARRRRELGIP